MSSEEYKGYLIVEHDWCFGIEHGCKDLGMFLNRTDCIRFIEDKIKTEKEKEK